MPVARRDDDRAVAVSFQEYYRLSTDPAENVNSLGDGNGGNDPPPGELAALAATLASFATCVGSGCVR